MNMDDIQKSKMDAFIPQIREHADYNIILYYIIRKKRDAII